MMYEVYILNPNEKGEYESQLLYYPNDETYVIFNSQLELALDEAGTLEFDIPEYNLRFNDFKLRKTMIQVLQNNTEIFLGEVREVIQNFDFTKHIYCVGELAFLFDSIQPQAKYQGTPYAMLKSMLDHHNSQVIVYNSAGKVVDDKKAFYIDQVDSKDNYVYHFTNREDTLSCIREKLCETLDVHIRIKKVNGKRYISLVPLDRYGRYCQQEIQFGENLLDYSNNMSAQDIATVCIPLGARLEEESRTSNAVEGLDEYVTIKGQAVNSYHKATTHDFVQIDSAVNTYGVVRAVKHWDDVTQANNLMNKAIDWLKTAQYENMTLEVNALDQNLLDVNIDTFDIGDTIHVWAEPFGMDTTFPVKKKTIYINDLGKNTVTLGGESQKSFTSQASNAVAKVLDVIPAVSPIMQEAKDNALSMLLDETSGGHVVFEYLNDSQGNPLYMDAISICDAPTIEKSTKRWRWSAGAFGYMKRDKAVDSSGKQVAWTDMGVAITANGQIVADKITTGTLKLAGDANDKVNNAYLEVYSGTTKVGEWNKKGLMAKSADYTYASGNYATKGMIIDMQNFLIRTPYFCLDVNGKLHAKGGGDIGGFYITDTFLTSNSSKKTYNDSSNDGVFIGTTGIGLGKGKFTVSNEGSMVAKNGYIGNGTNGWKIGDNNIQNGCTSVDDSSHGGTYVGVNGIRNQGGYNNLAHVRIKDGAINCNSTITGHGLYATAVNGHAGNIYTDGNMNANNYSVKSIAGASGDTTLTFPLNTSGSKYGYIRVINGLVVAIGSTGD